jgi:hypothetical protein
MARAAPARFPPQGAWPGVMRADLAAAFFDCRDTAELARRVRDGDIPEPTAMRGRGNSREPIWALEACRSFVASRHGLREAEAAQDDVINLV